MLQEILEAGEGISQAGLARHLKINPKTVCKKVTRVIKAGLMENVGCGAKSQTQELRLTAKGRDLIQGVSQRATLAA